MPHDAVRSFELGIAGLARAADQLTDARDSDTIRALAVRAARQMSAADGAAYVGALGGRVSCLAEDAVSPVRAGRDDALDRSLEAWCLGQRVPAAVEDVYRDARIPRADFSRTFVRSLAVVPIQLQPEADALAVYWASRRLPSIEELELLEALAEHVAAALDRGRGPQRRTPGSSIPAFVV